jgi:CBS-domain-containing membrane protein
LGKKLILNANRRHMHRRYAAMSRMTAKDIMTSPVFSVSPDTPLQRVAWLLTEYHISGVPVVDRKDQLRGVVSEADLLPKEAGLSAFFKPTFLIPGFSNEARVQIRKFQGRTAGELMTPDPITANENTPVKELASTMIEHNINRIPIVRSGRLVGIVSRNDVLKVFKRSDETLENVVQDRIREDLWIDLDKLQIAVQDGVVRISGSVAVRSEIGLIESYVREIDGVISIDVSGIHYEVDDVTFRLPTGFRGLL